MSENVERNPFGEAWRTYIAGTDFDKMTAHERALIRVVFIAGWHARGKAEGISRTTMRWNSEALDNADWAYHRKEN